MNGEITDFSLERMTKLLGLFHGPFYGENNIAQHLGAGFGIDVIMAVFAQREREHIGDGVDFTVFAVDFLNLSVVHDGHVHFRRALKIFHFQHGVAAAADQQTDAGGDFNRLLFVFNYDLDFFHNF